MVAGRSRALNRAHGVGVGNDVKWSLGGPYPGPLRTRQAARFIRRDVQRDTPDAETANWRAVCEKTAGTVRRAGRRKPSRPLSGDLGLPQLPVGWRWSGSPRNAAVLAAITGGESRSTSP